NTPVNILSGGERARLLLARLFAQPANLLIMDEPTNDLDIESLELLEDTLRDYPGTLLLVSHDRQFLDNVVTQVWAAQGDGRWREYVGGYTDWLAQRPVAPNTKSDTPTKPATDKPARAGKLSYKEQRALESLPSEIEALEREQSELIARMSEAGYHSRGAQAIKADQARAQLIETELEQKFNLWEQLEGR
ncbi:MAG TPA: ATP-binding cassette domain-containing protein, partial [Burkholderiaceae bacterium]|nr:ATP-binding cassette domain-containing protein [Burkholderiaceae bacterium]